MVVLLFVAFYYIRINVVGVVINYPNYTTQSDMDKFGQSRLIYTSLMNNFVITAFIGSVLSVILAYYELKGCVRFFIKRALEPLTYNSPDIRQAAKSFTSKWRQFDCATHFILVICTAIILTYYIMLPILRFTRGHWTKLPDCDDFAVRKNSIGIFI